MESLKGYFETFEDPFHDSVMRTLQLRYPKKSQEKGNVSMKEVENRIKNLEASNKKLRDRPNPPPRPRSRSRDRRRDGDGQRRSPSSGRKTRPLEGRTQRGDGPPKKPGSTDEFLNKAFQLAKSKPPDKDGKLICSHAQKGECTYGKDCRKLHECIVCGSKSHTAHQCKQLREAHGKKVLGL